MFIAQHSLTRKLNPGAFGTPLVCPFCNAKGLKRSRWQFIGKIGPFRIRYRCKDCGNYVQYDFANNNDFRQNHPYSPYKRSKWQKYVELFKQKNLAKGKTL